MIVRQEYLNKLISLKDKRIIKVRRECGVPENRLCSRCIGIG